MGHHPGKCLANVQVSTPSKFLLLEHFGKASRVQRQYFQAGGTKLFKVRIETGLPCASSRERSRWESMAYAKLQTGCSISLERCPFYAKLAFYRCRQFGQSH